MGNQIKNKDGGSKAKERVGKLEQGKGLEKLRKGEGLGRARERTGELEKRKGWVN